MHKEAPPHHPQNPSFNPQTSHSSHKPHSQIQEQFSERSSYTALVSDRVSQLKKEIEQLDEKLMNTNSVNLNEIQQSVSCMGFSSDEEEMYEQDGDGKMNERSQNEIEDHLFSKNNISQLKQSHNTSFDQSKWQSMLVKNNKQLNMSCLANTSHLSFDGEVSFDFEKLQMQMNSNMKQAFEHNLAKKKDYIQKILQTINQVRKESEAKLLKLTHLKYERDSLLTHLQAEELKKDSINKDLKEKLKRIEIKKKEEERAFEIAQEEIKRLMKDQEEKMNKIKEDMKMLEISWKEMQKNCQDGRNYNQKDVQGKISAQQEKIFSLQIKRDELQENVDLLKAFLNQIREEIQMTQEDLNSKLIQRAELVAQREELDQMLETGKQAFGKDFELYVKLNESMQGANGCSQNSVRNLEADYFQQKVLSFFSELLQQLKQITKEKHHPSLDTLSQKLDQHGQSLDLDRILHMTVHLATEAGVAIDKKLLRKRFMDASVEKDLLFEKREEQLKEIAGEIKRFEKNIKDNVNLVDNMILPQLKAMSTTFTDHKHKYKKLKQALFVLTERTKKAERELELMLQEKSKCQVYQNNENKCRKIEGELKNLRECLMREEEEMKKQKENAQYVEKEFRRSQQALFLKVKLLFNQLNIGKRNNLLDGIK